MFIAVDTSVLIGMLNPRDIWRPRAETLLTALRDAGFTLLNFDCAVAEAASTLMRRLHEQKRDAEVLAMLDALGVQIPPRVITWTFLDVPRLYTQVLDLMRDSSGELNFNDALIALECRERGIPAIASFDADFDQVTWLKRVAEPGDLPVANG
jgi:predicted nucleic acid-binding protein